MSNARGRRRRPGDAPRPAPPKPAPYDPDTVVLGVVGRPHGIRGELWLRPHNERGRSFERLRTLVLVTKGGARSTHEIVSLRPSPDGALVKLAGVDSREAAAALTLAEIRAPRAALPPLAPGEFYVNDVIGCAVAHVDGRALGVVAGTFWNGAQDVMIVKGDAPVADTDAPERDAPDAETRDPVAADVGDATGAADVGDPTKADGERLIPLIAEFVVSVDVSGRHVVVSWDDPE